MRLCLNKKIKLANHNEYIGRALNVAARLQSSIAQATEKNPEGKVLMSNPVYTELRDNIRGTYKVFKTTRVLKNISNGEEYLCKKIVL